MRIKHSKVIVGKTGLLREGSAVSPLGQQETLTLTCSIQAVQFLSREQYFGAKLQGSLHRLDLNIFVGLWSARHCRVFSMVKCWKDEEYPAEVVAEQGSSAKGLSIPCF